MKLELTLAFLFVLALNVFNGQSQNIFLNDAVSKIAAIPESSDVAKPTSQASVNILVNSNGSQIPVSKYIYGNNANTYMTQMVDQTTLLDYIKDLSPNIIRFPGGNLSSVYFWNAEKGAKPVDAPVRILDGNGAEVDPSYWYGKNTESWTISLDNYYQMLALTGNTGILTVNYGYARYGLADNPVAAAAHLAADWVRYDNGRTKFWEIGNESNGNWQAGYRINTSTNKDGQPEIVTGELYGKHFKVFADSMRNAAAEKGHQIYIGAQILQEAPQSWWNNTDKNWNSGVFQQAGNSPDYYIIHSYYTPYNQNSSATEILNTATKVSDDMMAYVTSAQTQAGITPKPIALTEWNIFAIGSKQMISYINGMHAAIVLGELIKKGYSMASRWDLSNSYDSGNDHGTFSSGNEPGIPQWNPRPSFFYMYYFQKYFGDTMIEANVNGNPNVLTYASSFGSGETSAVIINKGTSAQVADITVLGKGVGEKYYYYTLTAGSESEFSLKVNVNGIGPALNAGGPLSYKTIKANASTIDGGIIVNLPARSVTYVLIENGNNVVTALDGEKELLVQVYPNPASSRFYLKSPVAGQFALELIDVNGKIAMKKSGYTIDGTIEVQTDAACGLYVLKISSGDRTYIARVVMK